MFFLFPMVSLPFCFYTILFFYCIITMGMVHACEDSIRVCNFFLLFVFHVIVSSYKCFLDPDKKKHLSPHNYANYKIFY